MRSLFSDHVRHRLLPLLLLFATALVSSRNVWAAAGRDVYQQKCASCHGKSGEGVKDRYEGALFGEATLVELAERIADTMPEDDPDQCVGDEAEAVAHYIFNEFYSYEARVAKGLLSKPRVELSRLTVSQFRNSVADLLAQFTPAPRDGRPSDFKKTDVNGILGTYHQSKKMNKRDQLMMTRVDAAIDFDFKDQGPIESMNADAFSITWNGSIQTRSTGYYDFRLKTPNGVRLYLNTDSSVARGKLRDDDSATIRARLIDGWVSSGEMRTLSSRVFLLGGRSYPLRIEFFKYQDATASIQLEWKPPHDAWSVVGAGALRTTPAPRTFVVDTPFPPDDHSLGYERGSSASTEWHNAVANSALATSDEVIERIDALTGRLSDKQSASQVYPEFAKQIASVAFRRPLSDDEKNLYGEKLFTDEAPEAAVRRAVLLILTSPHFLYTNLAPPDEPPTQHTIASRLAFAMWDSLPDKKLRAAADRGELETREQIVGQAQRMLQDSRTRNKLNGFFEHWLELEQRDLAKDKQIYPEFDEEVVADLRRSLELFIDNVVWSEKSDYRELLQADYLLLNDRLQTLYGQSAEANNESKELDHEFKKVAYSAEGRSGILTHPYLLSAFAYHNNTSPIHRGVFLTRNIVGRQLKPPPVAVAFENSDFAPDLTMREKVTQLTRDQACQSCHEVINPLGFALENFDAVGRWRSKENDKPIDSRSDYTSAEGTTVSISSPRDIAEFAVKSPVAQRTFVKQVFQHLIKQDPAGYGTDTVEQLREAFVKDGFHVQKLLAHVAAHAATYGVAQ